MAFLARKFERNDQRNKSTFGSNRI